MTTRRSRHQNAICRSAFTLLEVVLALMLAVLLSLSLYTSMASAIKAKRTAMAAVEPTRAVTVAADIMRQDLESILPPTGILAGPFQGVHQSAGTGDNDDLIFYTIGSDPQAQQVQRQGNVPGNLPQLGQSQMEDPLSEGIRKVELALKTDVNPPALVRRVQRNLLPSSDAVIDEEIICRDVRSLSFRYFDGSTWQTDWDSTTQGDILPVSVSMTLELNDPDHPQPGVSTRRITKIIPLACGKILDQTTSTGGLP